MRRMQRGNDVVAWGRALVLAALFVLAQVTIIDQIEFGGLLRIDLPLLLVIAVASAARSDHAAVVGFGTGLAVDLFQLGPFGQHSLVYCVIGFAISSSIGGRGGAFRMVGSAGPSAVAYDAGSRAMVAGTATVFTSAALVVITALVEPTLPALSHLVNGVPLGSLAGSMLGIQAVALIARRARLVPGHRSSRLSSWTQAPTATGDTWQTSLSPVRRL